MSQTAVAAKLRKPLAEFIGTFAMVFCGCGAMAVNDITVGGVTHVGVGLVWGAIVMIMIYSLGEISGCHINPAVTIGFWAAGKFQGKLVPVYILAQTLGAVVASLALWNILTDAADIGRTFYLGTTIQAFLLEFIITFLLMFIILCVATGSKEQGLMAGLTIGFFIMLAAIFAGPITRASLNPARSIGPALVEGNLYGLWLYIAAPIAGALLAVPVWKIINPKEIST